MPPLPCSDIIRIWEEGQNQHPLDRALTILSAGRPGQTRDQLAALTIGQRDVHLLEIREETFGSTLKGFAICPQCTENLEFAMSTADLRIPPLPSLCVKEKVFRFSMGNTKFSFRLPNSKDLAAIMECEDVKIARKLIAQRCVLEAAANGKPIKFEELSAETLDKLAERMAECEPQAEILLGLQCPACSHKWQVLFDIVTFLWEEISMLTRRLLQEIHTLASAYKWREEDILAMSPIRRKYYLEMVV